LAFDLGSPSIRVLDLVNRVDRLTGGEQLPVVVSPLDPLDEVLDPPLDLDRILHLFDPTPEPRPLDLRGNSA
jgi:hypothetical protein